MLKGKKVQEVM